MTKPKYFQGMTQFGPVLLVGSNKSDAIRAAPDADSIKRISEKSARQIIKHLKL